jgi:carbonic anhydrase/acetyltransferase-like protein (isoleucine patch superfamily)
LPSRCIVGIGSVITKNHTEEGYLIAGVPAEPKKPLSEHDTFLIEQKTRRDLPDDI